MAAVKALNPKAEVARAAEALQLNINGARGLQEVMKTNLGPKGTMKMLVSGAGDIKLTKDGNVLLHEMVSPSYYVTMVTVSMAANPTSYGFSASKSGHSTG
jgi:chaperonin GroEL (HSP60 family)